MYVYLRQQHTEFVCARSDSLDSTNRWCCAYSFSSQAELNTLKSFRRIAAHKQINNNGNNKFWNTHVMNRSYSDRQNKHMHNSHAHSRITHSHTNLFYAAAIAHTDNTYLKSCSYVYISYCSLHIQQNAFCTY